MRLLREATSPGLVEPASPRAAARRPAARPWDERAPSRTPALLFAALLVLGLVPIWIVAHVPTQDGGNHVESVVALLQLPGSSLLQRYYLPNYGLQPNWLTQGLLAALLHVLPARAAEKVILSGYLVLLPLAFRAALPRTLRGRWAALAIFPFVHSYPFHMGFWNFTYSLVLFFAVVGAWYRTRGRLGPRRGLAFGALLLACFVAHSVSTAAALATIASILAWRAGLGLVAARSRGLPGRARRVLGGYLRRGVATAAWALPAVGLMAAFMVRQPKPLAYRPSPFDYVKHFASLYALVSFDRRELIVTGAVALVVVLAVALSLRARRVRRLRPVDGWLAAGLVAAALYFAMPDSVADGAQLNDRLALYPFFAALLWLGYAAVPVRRVRAVALALAALFLAGSALRLVAYRRLQPYLADYDSVAAHVAPHSTVLPLTFAPFGPRRGGLVDGKKLLSYRVEVFRHVAGYVVAERQGVDLDNSQANTLHAPVRWTALNPFKLMSTRPFGVEQEPPCVELWPFTALGGRVDYVVVWGATEDAGRNECGAAVLAELAAGYRRVFVSPMGMLELYRPIASAER